MQPRRRAASPVLALSIVAFGLGACQRGEQDQMNRAVQFVLDTTSKTPAPVQQAAGTPQPGKRMAVLGREAHRALLPEMQAKAEKNPEDFTAQYELAITAAQGGEMQLALKAAEKALQIDPKSNPARAVLAHALQQTGQLDGAAAQWEAITASGQPYSPIVDSNLGTYYKLQGRFDEAEARFRKALESKDDLHAGMIRTNLADLLIRKDKLDEAKEVAERIVADDKSAHFAHGLLGRIAFLQARYEEAIAEFAKELEVRPGAWEAHLLAALAYGRLQPPRLEEAEAALKNVSALRPGEEAYHKALLADLYVDAGQFEKGKTLATEALQELAQFREDHRNVAYHALSKAYAKLGDEAQAREFQQKFRQSLAKTDQNDPEQRRRIREMDSLFGSP